MPQSTTQTCSVVDCDRPSYSRAGWCNMHYQRVRKWGTPDGDPAKSDPSRRGIPAGMRDPKPCTACGAEKALTQFYRRRNGRVSSECKDCAKARSRNALAAYAARETLLLPESSDCSRCRRTLPASAFALNNTRKKGIQNVCLECHRDRKYGLEIGQYDALLIQQDGRCWICEKEPQGVRPLVVDHDHVTGHVRGLLCQNCNAGLGMFMDDPALLGRAIDYLKRAAE